MRRRIVLLVGVLLVASAAAVLALRDEAPPAGYELVEINQGDLSAASSPELQALDLELAEGESGTWSRVANSARGELSDLVGCALLDNEYATIDSFQFEEFWRHDSGGLAAQLGSVSLGAVSTSTLYFVPSSGSDTDCHLDLGGRGHIDSVFVLDHMQGVAFRVRLMEVRLQDGDNTLGITSPSGTRVGVAELEISPIGVESADWPRLQTRLLINPEREPSVVPTADDLDELPCRADREFCDLDSLSLAPSDPVSDPPVAEGGLTIRAVSLYGLSPPMLADDLGVAVYSVADDEVVAVLRLPGSDT